MFVIGTAGHIDHGKSSLIIRLTGTDPDRLPEEKQRGMTIDLGFAYYDMPNGNRIGIIDVPGHERFVRNMISGAGGIDAVILVVAADDGWMPQSQEHLQITKLLGVKYGFIALTKIDLVDKDWVDLVEEDIKTKVKDTFLNGAPVIRVSSSTGEGFAELKKAIEDLAGKVVEKEDIDKPRLYIDRSFVLSGMGGVVAGTLKGGSLKAGQEVEVFPSKKKGKVRTLQSHGNQIEAASPGQRTSISLTGIDKEYLIRGGVISSIDLIDDYPEKHVFAAHVEILPESKIILENRRRILMILGTTEIEGEIRMFNDDQIVPSGQGVIFIKPFEPVFGFTGDHFILRLPTPQVTIGGGLILDILDDVPRRKEFKKFSYLTDRIDLTPESYVLSSIEKLEFVNPEIDFRWCNFEYENLIGAAKSLLNDGVIDKAGDKYYNKRHAEKLFSEIVGIVKGVLENQPHLDGISPDIISDKLKRYIGNLDFILELMCSRGVLLKKKNKYDLPDRQLTVKGEVKNAADEIEKTLIETKFTPPLLSELVGEDKTKKEAVKYLLASGKAVKAGPTLIFHRDIWATIIDIVKATLNAGNDLTVAGLREKLNNSRKYAVPILEETDRMQITIRKGDIRIKGANFEKA